MATPATSSLVEIATSHLAIPPPHPFHSTAGMRGMLSPTAARRRYRIPVAGPVALSAPPAPTVTKSDSFLTTSRTLGPSVLHADVFDTPQTVSATLSRHLFARRVFSPASPRPRSHEFLPCQRRPDAAASSGDRSIDLPDGTRARSSVHAAFQAALVVLRTGDFGSLPSKSTEPRVAETAGGTAVNPLPRGFVPTANPSFLSPLTSPILADSRLFSSCSSLTTTHVRSTRPL